jgi:hypothetical protein
MDYNIELLLPDYQAEGLWLVDSKAEEFVKKIVE